MDRDIYTVSVPRVPGVTRPRMLGYIKEAVSAWGGQFEPRDGGYPGSAPGSGDPLGPPCVLMERGAVRVWAEPRDETKRLYAAAIRRPRSFLVIWADEGGAHEAKCRDCEAVEQELSNAGSASQSKDTVEGVKAWCEGAQSGEVREFPCGWIIAREP